MGLVYFFIIDQLQRYHLTSYNNQINNHKSMKISPYQEELIQLTADFLRTLGLDSTANKIQKAYPLPQWISKGNPLLKKGLVNVVKAYVRDNAKISAYYKSRKPEESQVEDQQQEQIEVEEEIQKKKSKRKGSKEIKAKSPKSPEQKMPAWMSAKFERPKKLEEEILEEQKKQTPKPHTPELRSHRAMAKQSSQQIESSEYESEKDSFELEPKKKNKKSVKQQKKEVKKPKNIKKKKQTSSESEQESEQQIKPSKQIKKQVKKQVKQEVKKQIKPQLKNGELKQEVKPNVIESNSTVKQNGYKQSFSRINVEEVGPIPQSLRDNSFQAKFRFGQGGDEWGQYGYDKLKDTRGDSFKKTKGKLKNRAYQGASIDVNRINSIPIL